MKRAILISAILSVTLATSVSAELIEGIVARVGDRIVTRSQFDERLKQGIREINQTATSPEEVESRTAKLSETLLEEILTELLIKDRADRLGITVTMKDVDDAVGRLKEQYSITSDDQFTESLEQAGLTLEQMRTRLRDTLLSNAVLGRELRSRAQISDKELRDRYAREKDRYRKPERAEISEIIITVDGGAEEFVVKQRRALADEVARQAKSGTAFAALATEFSDSPTKEDGGRLGMVAKGELIEEIDTAVFSAEEGQILGPIETRTGFHIVRVDKRIPSEVPGFEAIKDELRKNAGQETFQRDYDVYLESLRGEAFVVVYKENLPGA